MLLLAKPALTFLVEVAATTLGDLCGRSEGRTYAPLFQALTRMEDATGRSRGIGPTEQCQSEGRSDPDPLGREALRNSLFIPPRELSIGHRKAVRANLGEPDDRHEAVSSPVQTFRDKRPEGMRRDRK
jgi:hypothetical protein